MVGKVYVEGGDVKVFVLKVLFENYDYDNGKVLFKFILMYGV